MLNRHAYLSSTSSRTLRFLSVRSKTSNDCLSRSALSVAVSHQSPYHQLSPSSSSRTPPPLDASSFPQSDLGVRSSRPPDSRPPNDTKTPPKSDDPNNPPNHISDQEWEIRTGRAIHVVQETLPEFFDVGLVTAVNKVTGLPQRPHSVSPIPIHIPIPLPSAAAGFLEGHAVREDDEPIYSPDIRLSYTPPVSLPPPFPRTFYIDGLQMYVASSSFIRHTMAALYTDLQVQNVKMTIDTPSQANVSPALKEKHEVTREKSIILRQVVTGVARVSGKQGEWVIESTYTFSPLTGLIHQHTINAIHPAPHQAVYDSLRLGLSKFNFQWRGGQGTGAASGAGGA